MIIEKKYILLALNEDDSPLITNHYINEVLMMTKRYKNFDLNPLLSLMDSLRIKFETSKELNERQIEDSLICPIMRVLGNALKPQITLNNDVVDFCVYAPSEDIVPDGFANGYRNTYAIIESKRYGRIQNKYYIHKRENSDSIYQTLNYLNTMNLTLENNDTQHRVNFAILTDGYRWRIYSRNFAHNPKYYEKRFIEFNLEAIINCPDDKQREQLLKLFGLFFSKESLANDLMKYQKESSELETAVTIALKEQTYNAIEYIATGIWRNIVDDENPLLVRTLRSDYDIDVSKAHVDGLDRGNLLKVVYDESLVFLLRALFVLYSEDRRLFNEREIPKIIKGKNNILEIIHDKGRLNAQCSVTLSETFAKVDKKYNGGLFSKEKHPLLYDLNISDVLFANAIDNLCRVRVKNKTYTVDFSSISVRELGSIYESLLEYKLGIIDKDIRNLPSILNKRYIRQNVRKGDLYLINHAGERKASGSYYTPDLIVEHLVNAALGPKLDSAKQAHGNDFEELFKAVLDIKICDPAVGSGHMIQACYSKIINFLRQSLEEMRNKNISQEIWTDDLEYNVRTQVARKCIYGVDLNPYAVEIAKLVLWIKVFNKDKPFEFFDYNLACGNSLVGIYERIKVDDRQIALFKTQEEMEMDINSRLLKVVEEMMKMPRDTVERVHKVYKFWQDEVMPVQREAAFAYNIKIAQWLMPEKKKEILLGYQMLIDGIDNDVNYMKKVFADDPSIHENVLALKAIDAEIRERYKPLHGSVTYPHVAVKGGFDVVVSNPPWNKIKVNHNEFFSNYITDYSNMEASAAKKLAEQLMTKNPDIRVKWNNYKNNVKFQNDFYQDSFNYQVYKIKSDDKNLKGDNSQAKERYEVFKGDPNLYKVFLEKIYNFLAEGGMCGVVIPDNFNIDNGCTGLRHMILENTTIKELIMFENRNKLFDIHVQYKFDSLLFEKIKPLEDYNFIAGFYWHEPYWLDKDPKIKYVATIERNKEKYHIRYPYSTKFIRQTDPDLLTIYEFKTPQMMEIFEKMIVFPSIGDEKQNLHIHTFREFDMTIDNHLFNQEGVGWPLFQGRTIHHYNSNFNPIERWIVSSVGEDKLSKKWNVAKKNLFDRKYRIAWRSIASATNERTLISTVIPRGVFCGNSLNLATVFAGNEISNDFDLIAGVNVILSSLCADFYIRVRGSMNVNAFMVNSLPLPRDIELIKELGKISMKLYVGDEFDEFRGDVPALTDEVARNKLIAKLDARVATMYNLTYEEYQFVLSTFPLVDENYKKRCLNAYNEWKFEI